MDDKENITGIVLSGGGARGAYEVGVVSGIIEVLALGPDDPPPFQVFSGSSVGAINASFLAANAHRNDLGVHLLERTWNHLTLHTHLRLDLFGLGRLKNLFSRDESRSGQALIDPTALEEVVRHEIDWTQLRKNVDQGFVRSLVVAALRVFDGQTCLFVETAPGVDFNASKDPRRSAIPGTIGASHVLASAAIPLIFPVRELGGQWYCDGSIRSNTPISPALRSGADRLVVVSLRHNDPQRVDPEPHQARPGPLVLLGKVLNALLLDPVGYDLQVLTRLNRILAVLDEALDPTDRARVDAVTLETRGVPYRHVNTLLFSPSEDLGEIAGTHLRETEQLDHLGRLGGWFMRRAARADAGWELDLASYILFDGDYARRLIDIGRDDALKRKDEIRRFFGRD